MAFRASQIALQRGFETLLSVAAQQNLYLSNWSTRLQSNITALDAVEIVASINRALTVLDAAAALPGMADYAKTQFDDPAYDVVSEYNAMHAALVAVRNWLATNIPANGITISNGVQVGAVYAPAATAPLRTLVIAAQATID